jgi:putative hydrolase of the HAD superfamily
MGREVRQPAVLLDAMGTLLRLEDPAPRLRAALIARIGVDVGAAAAAAAIRAEIGYYRAHLHRGRDAESLGELRADCAEAMRPALPPEAAGVPGDLLTAALLDALAFSPYPDAAPALRALRAAGCALVVVSNWDYSLHERLEQTGLAPLVDAAVASAELGAAKPDRAIFERALELAGAAPERAWHAGDSVREDVEGARAARIRAVLVARDEPPPARDRPGGADRERSGGADRLPSSGGDHSSSGGADRVPSGGADRFSSGGEGRHLPEGVPVLASLEGLPELVVSGGP